MTKSSAGKGDRRRPGKEKEYRRNYERIFGKYNVRHKDADNKSNSSNSREIDTDE